MNSENKIINKIYSQKAEAVFAELYGSDKIKLAQQRYATLLEEMLACDKAENTGSSSSFEEKDLRFFSAPGRTELGGNHTDHNCGKVLAAAIHLDTIAVVKKRNDNTILFRSRGYPDAKINLMENNKPAISPLSHEKGKTEALIRGIAAEMRKHGVDVNGFTAMVDSNVLPGSGLSSSAAVEVLIGRIFDCLFGSGTMNTQKIASIGQIAENEFFGKPCGLMDQTACASGGVVAIDFGRISGETGFPQIKNVNLNLSDTGYALCVVNTGGNHADLTLDYSGIPAEMKAAAAFYRKKTLGELNRETLLSDAVNLKKIIGDRALLRSLHFFDENDRVDEMTFALEEMNQAAGEQGKLNAFSRFLELVNESGDSSWQLLQNVYSPQNVKEQGISTALALTKNFIKHNKVTGACRVHGGGFAGTIQVYIPADTLRSYRGVIEKVFGTNSLTPLRIRQQGAVELDL